jgi:hypothetical protein
MSKNKPYPRNMTVVKMRDAENADAIEVVFLESARFYRLPKETPSFDSIVALLKSAIENGKPVRVETASIDSSTIERIGPAGGGLL